MPHIENHENIQNVQAVDFVAQSSPACLGCKSFGTMECPRLREAIADGLCQKALQKAIEIEQRGRILNPCEQAGG